MKRANLLTRRTLVLLATLLAMAVTASMGQWQLRRAAQKQALIDERQARIALPALDGRALADAQEATERQGLIHRTVRLQGEWLAQHTVFLENRQMQGRTGFYMVTPLRIADTGAVILVQRGWLPRHFSDRTALPQVATPAETIELTGHLAPWPSRMYDFGAVESGPIRQNLDFEAYRQQTGLALQQWSLQQSGDARDGLLRDWPVLSTGVEKHHGYALQWFGLCALLALLYVWFQIVQPLRKSSRR